MALFITCLSDQFYPRVGTAITKILEAMGCEVLCPREQTCCGQPRFNNGFHDQARELAKRYVEIFEPYDYIITPSGSCCAMVREQYPQLLGGDHAWERGAERVAWRTFEFVEFLDRVLKADFTSLSLRKPTTVTYHYTCHLRGIGMTDEAVRFIKQIGNVQYVPLEKADQCCGFGGTFAVKYPAISRAIVADKAQCIARTEAEVAVVSDAGCTMNIAGMCHREGVPTRIVHFAELLAEAMGLDIDKW